MRYLFLILVGAVAFQAAALPIFGSSAATNSDDYDDFLKSAQSSYDSFLDKSRKEYNSFREKINQEYADFLTKPWKPTPVTPAVPMPEEPTVPPIVEEDPQPRRPIDETPIEIPRQIPNVPNPSPRPNPIEPISPDVPDGAVKKDFTMFGTKFSVNVPTGFSINLPSVNEQNIGNEWERISLGGKFDGVVGQLLEIRDAAELCDWAYYHLVKTFSESMFPDNSGKSVFLEAYIFNQSGYDTRFAIDGFGRLRHLIGSREVIYGKLSLESGNISYYDLDATEPGSYRIVPKGMPGVRCMSMDISNAPRLEWRSGGHQVVSAVHYPDLKVEYEINKNLLDFYSTYLPTGLSENELIKYLRYAKCPLTESTKSKIYPALRQAILGKSQRDAANIIIDFCESFPYELDDDMWGGDRIFFAEETLHYRKSDCEDHAILFVNLIKDLLELKTALIYYPGHLAAAVVFTEDIPGSYFIYDSKRYTVCDPTIFYAEIGTSMRSVDSSQAVLIPLD